MNVHSLSFRAFKAVMALPFQVTVVIPLILLYCSGWQPDNMVLWTSFLGIAVFFVGLLLAVSTIRLFSKLGNGTLAPWDATSKMVITGPYAYVRNPMITGVVLILIGEALILASWVIGLWRWYSSSSTCFILCCPKSPTYGSVSVRNMRNTAGMFLVTFLG